MNDQSLNMSQGGPTVMGSSQEPQAEVNFIYGADQNLNMSPENNIAESEQTVTEKLPNKVHHSSPGRYITITLSG